MEEELSKLIDKYLDGGLSEAETEELNDLMLSSPELRKLFRQKACIHSSLVAHYDASDMEELYGVNQSSSNITKFSPMPWLVLAATLLIGLFFVFQSFNQNGIQSIARISYSEKAVWLEELKHEELLSKGKYTLNSGMVELKLPNEVTVAIEAPASFSLISAKTMQLFEGRISAEVGEKGIGFEVITPEGKVIDLGTRFGVYVPKGGKTEAHVFEGEINVVIDDKTTHLTKNQAVQILENGRLIELDVDDYIFPMPGYNLNKKIVDGGFEEKSTLVNSWPQKAGHWGGDHCELVNEFGGVSPAKGESMLRFVKPHLRHEKHDGHTNSQLWQVIDLRNQRNEIVHGGTNAQMKALFNRSSDAVGDVTFSISLMAFDGEMKEVKNYWNAKQMPLSEMMAQSSSKLIADQDPNTWEQVGCQLNIPSGTDFLLIQVAAQHKVEQGVFKGHFADHISVQLYNSPRKSSPSNQWNGKGDFLNSKNWKDNTRPDFTRNRIIISGDEEAVINDKVELKQSLIIAQHNQSRGFLRISKEGSLNISRNGSFMIGFNTEAEASLVIEGVLRTACFSSLGRNNIKSDVLIDGGTWESTNDIRMAQYGNRLPDTHSTLKIVNGGKFMARRLQMINDFSTVELIDGEVSLDRLKIGGDNGEAIFKHHSGLVSLNQLEFGEVKSIYQFNGDHAVLEIQGKYELNDLLNLENSTWQYGDKKLQPNQLQLSHFKKDNKEWTRLQPVFKSL